MLLGKEKHGSTLRELGAFNISAAGPWYPDVHSRVTLL